MAGLSRRCQRRRKRPRSRPISPARPERSERSRSAPIQDEAHDRSRYRCRHLRAGVRDSRVRDHARAAAVVALDPSPHSGIHLGLREPREFVPPTPYRARVPGYRTPTELGGARAVHDGRDGRRAGEPCWPRAAPCPRIPLTSKQGVAAWHMTPCLDPPRSQHPSANRGPRR